MDCHALQCVFGLFWTFDNPHPTSEEGSSRAERGSPNSGKAEQIQQLLCTKTESVDGDGLVLFDSWIRIISINILNT